MTVIKKVGYFYAENIMEPREIGQVSDDYLIEKYNGKTLYESDIPCIMTFTKTESIDAMIRQLEITKQCMIEDDVLNPVVRCTVFHEEDGRAIVEECKE